MVPGLVIGHAEDTAGCTGCTVVLGPFRAAADIRGMATGSREMDALSPLHVVAQVDAILLTGGSAFGLAAADGVMQWLAERGRGFETPAARVPIVPAAVLYDLAVGSATRRPDAAMGRAACDNATADNVRDGRIGAGCGATAGKLYGGAVSAARTGLGVASVAGPGCTLTAIAAVNPIGDVLGADGRIIAGARTADGTFADSRQLLADASHAPWAVTPGTNTTLVIVATDAPLSRLDLQRVARMAATGVARRIAPVHTPFDGDVVFAISTAPGITAVDGAALLAIGSAAATAVENAIERAATTE
jgi:L-aminopeptidase/D-esterase-like protein